MRALPVAAIVAGLLLLTACQPEHQSGDAAPAGSARPQPSPSTIVETSSPPAAQSPSATRTSTTSKPTAVLGPNGFGALRLGMTRRQAEATGLVDNVDPKADSGCESTKLLGGGSTSGTVLFNGAAGIVAITAEGPDIKTPEGIHVGSSGADMRRAYPTWRPLSDPDPDNARGYADAPGSNNKAEYNITVRAGTIYYLFLQAKPHYCYE